MPKILPKISKKPKKSKTGFQNEEQKEKHSKVMKKYWSDPENRKRHSKAMKKYWSNPENRKRQSEHRKKWWSDPEFKKFCKERMKSPESKEKVRKHIEKFVAIHGKTPSQKWWDEVPEEELAEIQRKKGKSNKETISKYSEEELQERMRPCREALKKKGFATTNTKILENVPRINTYSGTITFSEFEEVT